MTRPDFVPAHPSVEEAVLRNTAVKLPTRKVNILLLKNMDVDVLL